MEVSCSSCPARFAVPDDKVRGRKVRIACKRCGSPIILDGTQLSPAAPKARAPKQTAEAADKPAAAALKPAAVAPKPAAAAPKPAVVTPKPALAAPKPAAVAPKPAVAAPKSAAVVPKPGADAPKPATSALGAKGLTSPRPGASPSAPKVAPPRDDNDWSALSESAGKPAAWREPAAALPTPASVPRPAATAATKGVSFAKKTMLGGLEPPPGAAPAPPRAAPPPARDQKAPANRTPFGAAPPTAGPPSARTSKPDLADGDGAEPEWTVALTDEHHEEMGTPELVQLYVRGSIDQETFIWADGMEDWKRPWEIPMIAAALGARGLSPLAAVADADDDYPMDEPAEEDATIVASLGAIGPPSSRGKLSSGVWHEPGRDDNEIGFEDVTVSLDSKGAMELLSSARAPGGRLPQRSKPEMLADQFDDVPTRIEEEHAVAVPPPSGLSHDVDDLLSDMDERTLAMEDGFQAVSRPMSSSVVLDDDDTTMEQRLSAEAAAGGNQLFASSASPDEQAQELFGGLDLGAPPGRDQPLDSLWEPTGIQPVSSPYGAPGAMPMPQPNAPYSAAQPAPKKSRALGCVLVMLFLLMIVAGAGVSFYLKQPPSLYGPDGRPKIPGLSQ
ncbi:MAG: zinc-ribbon domain-containing protein [Myxococcales bacterium]|nr:zinc-ribbon domain-containing protein [Myxococcales bacterium]